MRAVYFATNFQFRTFDHLYPMNFARCCIFEFIIRRAYLLRLLIKSVDQSSNFIIIPSGYLASPTETYFFFFPCILMLRNLFCIRNNWLGKTRHFILDVQTLRSNLLYSRVKVNSLRTFFSITKSHFPTAEIACIYNICYSHLKNHSTKETVTNKYQMRKIASHRLRKLRYY